MPEDRTPTEDFVLLLGAHEQAMMAYILSLVPNWHDARDIAQETRLQLWREFDQYDPSKNFGGWALAIAHWQIKRFRTNRGRDRVTFADDLVEQFAPAAAEVAADTDRRHAAIAYCIEKLDAIQRQLIGRFFSDKSQVRQIADQQGRSYEAVRKQLFRTRLELRECVERRLGAKDRS